MAKLKLNPWGFPKDETIQLYWLCSPFRTQEGDWLVKAAFYSEKQSQLTYIDYPWGTLPALVIGHNYINGKKEDKPTKRISKIDIIVPDIANGHFCKAFDIFTSLYDFKREKQLGFENIWKFTVDGNEYYLPCLEIIRVFLTPSKTFANAVLRPNGLDFFIESAITTGDSLKLSLNRNFPIELATNKHVGHLVWLLYDNEAKKCWNSVYQNIFSQAIEKSMYKPVSEMSKINPIKVIPPYIGSSHIVAEGISVGSKHLITRILNFSLNWLPFKEIVYTHPGIKEDVPTKKTENSGKREDDTDEVELDASGASAKKKRTQSKADTVKTGIQFGFKVKIRRKKEGSTLIYDSDGTDSGGTSDIPIIKSNIVTTNEPIYGGEINPVEFDGLEEVKEIEGLEDFLSAISFLRNISRNIRFEFDVVDLICKKKFCEINGNPRKCVIVKVSQNGVAPCYIFEFSRPDEWSISTLIIQAKKKELSSFSAKEEIVRIISNVAEGNDHWQLEYFKNNSYLSSIRLKHSSKKGYKSWANRIFEKRVSEILCN